MTDQLCDITLDHDTPKRAATGLRVCGWHENRARRAVEAAPVQYLTLGTCLQAGGSSGLTGLPTGTRDPGININHRVAALRTDLRNSITTWARIAIDERHMTTPPDTIEAIAAFIAAQLDWYLSQPFARNFTNDMIDNHDTAQRLIDANHVRMFEVADCPQPDCTGRLWARLRPRDDRLPHDVTCDQSPEDDDGQLTHYWPADRWLTLGRRLTRNQADA